MKKWLSRLAFPVFVILILGAFQWWAVTAREREWWWFHGGPEHMAYADMNNSASGDGHILMVERYSENALPQEFEVEWRCDPMEISWGEAWTVNDNFDQIDREPAPSELAKFHVPKNSMEKIFLSLACDLTRTTPQVIRLRKNQSPVELTYDAFKMVDEGMPPPEALQRALATE